MASTFRAAVEAAIKAGEADGITGMLADDVEFRSPAVHKPYRGRVTVTQLLTAVFTLFEDFRYVAEFDSADGEVLMFEARVGDRDIQGVDIVRLDDAGRVASLTVMIRPLSGLTKVVEGMSALLAAAEGAQGPVQGASD